MRSFCPGNTVGWDRSSASRSLKTEYTVRAGELRQVSKRDGAQVRPARRRRKLQNKPNKPGSPALNNNETNPSSPSPPEREITKRTQARVREALDRHAARF